MKKIKFLQFYPYFSEKIWAGKNIAKFYNLKKNYGEAWIISAYEKKESVCKTPSFFNKKLSWIWQNHSTFFGKDLPEKFPNLLKIIDTNQPLSIQVHPNDDFAKKYNSYGKDECWYVLANKQKNKFIYDFKPQKKATAIKKILNKDFKNLFNKVDLLKDDFLYVESGKIHAIPKNVTVFELQQSSDLTFRVYDYDRLENGKKRKLHTQESIACLSEKSKKILFSPKKDFLVKNNFFSLRKIICKRRKKIKVNSKNWTEIFVVSGQGKIDEISVRKFDTFIMGADFKSFYLQGILTLLVNEN